jgi:ketosteroid isomerase-like protein
MKKIVFIVILISVSTLLLAQQQLTKKQQEAQQTVVQLFEALSNRDSVGLKEYCTADVAFYEYGQVWNIDTLINKAIKLNKAADFKRTNSFNFINTTTDKTMAWLTYHLNSTITKDGKQSTAQWLETVVLTKYKKRWKVKHLHSTLIKRS